MNEHAPKTDSIPHNRKEKFRKIEGDKEFWARWYSPLADAINNNALLGRRKDKQEVTNFIIEDLQRQIEQEAESGNIADPKLALIIKRLKSPSGDIIEIPQQLLVYYIDEKIKQYDELQVSKPKTRDLVNLRRDPEKEEAELEYRKKLDEEARRTEILKQQIVDIDERTQLPKGEKPDIKKQVRSVSRWLAAGLAIMAAFNALKKHEAPEIAEPENIQPSNADTNLDLQAADKSNTIFQEELAKANELARQTTAEELEQTTQQMNETDDTIDMDEKSAVVPHSEIQSPSVENEKLITHTVQPNETLWDVLQKKFPDNNKNGIDQNAINKYWDADLKLKTGQILVFGDKRLVIQGSKPDQHNGKMVSKEIGKGIIGSIHTTKTPDLTSNKEPGLNKASSTEIPLQKSYTSGPFDEQSYANGPFDDPSYKSGAINISTETVNYKLGKTPERIQSFGTLIPVEAQKTLKPKTPAEEGESYHVEVKDNPSYHTATAIDTDETDRGITQDGEKDQDTNEVEKSEKVNDNGPVIDQQTIEDVRAKITNYDANKRVGKTKKGETKSQPLELAPDEQAIAINLLLNRAVDAAKAINIGDIAIQMAKQTLSVENAREWHSQIFDVLNKTSREAKTMLGITEAGLPKQFYEHRLGQAYKQLGKYINIKDGLETTPAAKEFFNSDEDRVARGETNVGE